MSFDSVSLEQLLGTCILISVPEHSDAVGRSNCCPPSALWSSVSSWDGALGPPCYIPRRWHEWWVECRAGQGAFLAVTQTRPELRTHVHSQMANPELPLSMLPYLFWHLRPCPVLSATPRQCFPSLAPLPCYLREVVGTRLAASWF